MDLQSLYGYRSDSPYRFSPYLDIETPDGQISMDNVSMPLIGISDMGEIKHMKPGKRYKYRGKSIREIPMQVGGYSSYPAKMPVYQTQEEVNAANAFSRDFAKRHNLSPYFQENSIVARKPGDPVVQYVNPDGTPFVPAPSKKLVQKLPMGIGLSDIQSAQGMYWYTDPHTGDVVDVDPSVVNTPGFQKPKAAVQEDQLYRQMATTKIKFKTGGLGAAKAAEMLRDGTAHKKPLTGKQKHYFQAVAHGWQPKQLGGYQKQLFDFINQDDDDEIEPMVSTDDIAAINQVDQDSNQGDYENNLAMDTINQPLSFGDEQYSSTNPFIQGNDYAGVSYPSTTPVQHSNLNTNQKAQYAMDFFKKKGLPAVVAAGIVGNLMQESGHFRDDVIAGTRTGDSGLGFGIAQWHPDRKAGLLKWAQAQGMNPYTFDTQLGYVYYEGMQRGDIQGIMNVKEAGEAARLFAKSYERPKIIDPNRINYARSLPLYKQGGQILNYGIWE